MKTAEFIKSFDLDGKYDVYLEDGSKHKAILPGTLDENKIGYKDDKLEKWHPDADIEDVKNNEVITTRFTRKYTYCGKALYKKNFKLDADDLYELTAGNTRAFICIERSRKVNLFVNDEEAEIFIPGTLSTPYVFEVSELLKKDNSVGFWVDNNYNDWPAQAIKYSSQASDETQTNWNGILGNMKFVITKPTLITNVKVFPGNGYIDLEVEIDSLINYQDTLVVESFAFKETYIEAKKIDGGKNVFKLSHIILSSDILKWDEYEGNLYQLKIYGKDISPFYTDFGIRSFGDRTLSYFTLNQRRIFLRGETNCAVFPETGYASMNKDYWVNIFNTYKSYGINFVRFHSYCPPEVAFEVADRVGILIQPELSCWDPYTCLQSDESFNYYKLEAESIISSYSNHPSFVMLSLGNESACDEDGQERMHSILDRCRELDDGRLYTCASNAFYGAKGADSKSDFYTSSNYKKEMIRACSANGQGYINNHYPDSKSNYDDVLEKIKKEYGKPVMSFEVGQYEVLPGFEEIAEFKGVVIPENYKYVEKRVKENGFDKDWAKRVEATISLSSLCYREEIEAALRTKDLGGICLLGLQDFPGQGTALVGMINSHYRVKPFLQANPAIFNIFCDSVVPLIKLDKYVYTNKESLHFIISLANYGKDDICSKINVYLKKNGSVVNLRKFGRYNSSQGSVEDLCEGYFDLTELPVPNKYSISVEIGKYHNEYDIWVYSDELISYEAGKTYGKTYIATTFDEAKTHLDKGQKVLLMPEASEKNFPYSFSTDFSTDFWSVGTFKNQSGYMGLLAQNNHGIFNEFPTEMYAQWQWWILTKDARAMMLPEDCNAIVKALDCYSRLRNAGFIYENENLIVSSLGLLQKQNYIEARALVSSIINYLNKK